MPSLTHSSRDSAPFTQRFLSFLAPSTLPVTVLAIVNPEPPRLHLPPGACAANIDRPSSLSTRAGRGPSALFLDSSSLSPRWMEQNPYAPPIDNMPPGAPPAEADGVDGFIEG